MKKILPLLAFAFLPTTSKAAEVLCGISVQNANIIYSPEADVAYVRAILKFDNAKWVECFDKHGAVIVATFGNGEIRAIIL